MEDNDTICLKENKNYSQYKDDYTSTQLHKDDAYQMSTYYHFKCLTVILLRVIA